MPLLAIPELLHPAEAFGNQGPRPPFELNEESLQRRGLLSLWTAFSGNSDDFTDLTGRSEKATVSGPNLTIGKFGRAWDFDGTSHRIDIDNANHLYTTQVSWAGWLDWRDAGSANLQYVFLLGNSSNPIADISILCFFNNTNNTFSFRRDWTTGFLEYTYAVPAGGGLMHCAITYDGSNAANAPIFYLNAVPQTESGSSNSASGTVNNPGTAKLEIGNRSSDGGRGFNGKAYEQRFANAIWTPGEVSKQYNPQTIWDIYHETYIPRIWPGTAGGTIHEESISATINLSQTAAATLVAENSIDIDVTLGQTHITEMTFEPQISLGPILGYGLSTQMTIEEAVATSINLGISTLGGLVLEDSITFDFNFTDDKSSVITKEDAATYDIIISFTPSDQLTAEDTTTYNMELGLTAEVDIPVINESISFTVQFDVNVAATMTMEEAISMATQYAMTAAAGSILSAIQKISTEEDLDGLISTEADQTKNNTRIH